MRLTRAAIRIGRHPAVWKRATGVVILKPGEDDYTWLKAYRSISLLSCMGNVVEKVVAELLSGEADKRGLLSDGEFRCRKGWSAIDPAAIMVDRAHAAWTNGLITGMLLMDIKPAVPSMAKRKASQLDEGQANGWRPYTMEGELSPRKNGGYDNRRQFHGMTTSSSRGSAGLTCVTDPLCDLHLKTDQMGRRVCIRS